MNAIRRLLLTSLAAASVFSISSLHAADANVTGTWTMQVQSPLGSGSPTFVLKQEGTTITGTYKGQLGESPVKGSVKGNEVSIVYQINAQGVDLTVTYAGTVAGDAMQGKVSYGDMGEGTFTGKKG